MSAFAPPMNTTPAARRQFVVKVARRCEHFLRRAAEAEDSGRPEIGADYRRLAAFQSADAFKAMSA